MSNNGIARVHYFERQFLRTQDFADEQAYHIAMRRRHNIAHHTWGIVHGLELVAEEGNLFVQPGMAVDGYGRELILAERQPLSIAAFVEKGSDVLDVWLVYNRVGSDVAPRGYVGCGADGDAGFYRWQEQPLVRLAKPEDPTNPRQPESVPAGDLDFDPSRTPPDDPQEDWPVFLGRVLRAPANPDQPYSVDLADRPYVGLVGEAVVAPSGRARVQIGAEQEADPWRFAVFVPDPEAHPEAYPAAGQPQPSLGINAAGETTVNGHTTLHGDLTLAGGAIEFQVGPARSRSDPEAPRPWRIYRYFRAASTPQESDVYELRVEMAGGTAGRNQVVIGTWSADAETFVPCLTIADDCTVTVHGNLVVEGSLIEQQKRADPVLSTEARAFLVSGLLSGIAGANVLLERFYRSPFAVQPAEAVALAMRVAPEAGVRAVAETLTAEPEHLSAFVELIRRRHPELAARLREALAEEDEG